MKENDFFDTLSEIEPLNEEAMKKAKVYQDSLAMPPNSMGRLQKIAIQLAGITGRVHNEIGKKRIIVFASDNGVVSEGVSSAPQSVTLSQAENMTLGKTGMSCLAKHFGCEVQVVDVGMNTKSSSPLILDRCIRRGTCNIASKNAMSREECLSAIGVGLDLAYRAFKDNIKIIGIGEMGIGNTTTSTAVLCALTGEKPEEIAGRGGGLTDSAFYKKIEVIKKALCVNAPKADDVLDVLSKVGGFDIASMCGAFIGGAVYHIPVVIDGYISIAAALCAYRLCPSVRGYMFPSHLSREKGYLLASKELSTEPFLMLGMALGEGSGCPLAFEVIEASCVMMNKMATFHDAKIDDSYLDDIRSGL